MKPLKSATIALLFFAFAANAQVSVSVNVNAPAPRWIAAPVPEARYYYLPDIQVYYDRPAAQFIYMSPSGWVRAGHLPASYSHYDLYRGRTICISDYHGHAPYTFYSAHRVKYAPAYRPPVRTVNVKEHKGHGHKHGHHKPHKGHGKAKHKR